MRIMIRKFLDSDIFRYLFFGGLTVLVNLGCFYLFTEPLGWSLEVSNILSVILALLFAYFTNSRFVFHPKHDSFQARLREFWRFVNVRMLTLLLEVLGVPLLISVFMVDDMVAKAVIQVIVIVLNYVFSKLIVFKNTINE